MLLTSRRGDGAFSRTVKTETVSGLHCTLVMKAEAQLSHCMSEGKNNQTKLYFEIIATSKRGAFQQLRL